jgi:hypothetical protein
MAEGERQHYAVVYFSMSAKSPMNPLTSGGSPLERIVRNSYK